MTETWDISIRLDLEEITDELADKVYEAGFDDSLLHSVDSKVFVDVERSGSLPLVMSGLLRDILAMKIGVKELLVTRK